MLSRRGLFGFLAAAPLAAPAIAKELARPLHAGGIVQLDGPLPLIGERALEFPDILRSRDGGTVIDFANGIISFTDPGADRAPIFSSDVCYLAKPDDFDGVGCA